MGARELDRLEVLGGALAAGLALLVAAAGAAPPERADAPTPYRTVAVFGDTQDLTTGRAGGEEALAAMVDWVLDHRDAENIDFVLHVGDLVHQGGMLRQDLPSECFRGPRCGGEPPHDRRACQCAAWEATPREWERFDAQWRRLDGVVPYAIVRGNHDNRGLGDPDAPGFRRGFAQYFGKQRVAELPGYLESYPGDDDVAHAWRFTLGDLPVLVIGLSWAPSQRQLAWAESLLREHPGTSAIVLSHRFFQGIPVDHTRPLPSWTRLVAAHPAQIFMAVAGHVAPGEVALLQREGHPLLRIRTDFQQRARNFDAAGQSYLNLLRFYLHPGEGDGRDGRDQVEIDAYSPLRGSHPLSRVKMPRRPFELRGRSAPSEQGAER